MSESESELLQYFSKLLLDVQHLKMEQLPSREQILFIFVEHLDGWREWLRKELQVNGVILRRGKVNIIKIVSDRLMFQHVTLGGVNCFIKPTFHWKCKLLDGQNLHEVEESIAKTKDQKYYLLGRKFNTIESDTLEFKNYRPESLMSNPELILKTIVAMNNLGQKSKVILGIAFDKDLNGHAVSGLYIKQHKLLLLCNQISKAATKYSLDIKIEHHACAVLLEDKLHQVSDLYVVEIDITPNNTLVALQPGRYLTRNQGNAPISLEELYHHLKALKLEESGFIDSLHYHDSLKKVNK